jgi:hypothetical protein
MLLVVAKIVNEECMQAQNDFTGRRKRKRQDFAPTRKPELGQCEYSSLLLSFLTPPGECRYNHNLERSGESAFVPNKKQIPRAATTKRGNVRTFAQARGMTVSREFVPDGCRVCRCVGDRFDL